MEIKDFLAGVGVIAIGYVGYQGYKKYIADPLADELAHQANRHANRINAKNAAASNENKDKAE